MKFTKHIFIVFLGCANPTFAQDKWTSADGKEITAKFVRISGDNVVLEMKGKEYALPATKLSKQSQDYANYMQENLQKLATKNISLPIISEASLNEILSFNASLAEGKNFLVKGHVKSFDRPSALSTNTGSQVGINLQGGTSFIADYTNVADGTRTKIKVEANSVVLLKYRTLDGGAKNPYQDHTPEKTLLSSGESVIFRATVEKGKIIGTGLASSQEITEADMLIAKQKGDLTPSELSEFSSTQIRINYLEAALEGNAGTASVSGTKGYIGTVTYEYSKAEKEAMRKELEVLRAQLKVLGKP